MNKRLIINYINNRMLLSISEKDLISIIEVNDIYKIIIKYKLSKATDIHIFKYNNRKEKLKFILND